MLSTLADAFVVHPGAAAALSVGLSAAGVAALLRCHRAVAGTTLAAPVFWALGCLAATAGVETVAASWQVHTPAWLAYARYLAAATTLAPSMALLGARRPQDKAWQFIVLSLIVVLWLPVGSGWALGTSRLPELHAAWSWFLLALIGVGWINHLPTRYWLASGLVAAGQLCLLSDQLPFGLPPLGPWRPLLGLACLVLAIVLAARAARRRPAVVRPLDRLWHDFRDAFGLLWAARVAERFNASAAMYDWPVRLGWGGLKASPTGDEATPSPAEADPRLKTMETNLKSLLRRFVSPAWIARRLEQV
ncbi:MAG: hypothetical protein WD403_00940 [Pirellulales bacterium]